MNRKTDTHSARKRCTKCGVVAWYRPRERKCKEHAGMSQYYCWGPLVAAPITRHKRGDYVDTLIDGAHRLADDDARRGAQYRRRATHKIDDARRRIAATQRKMERVERDTKRELARLRRLVVKQQRAERKWTKEATLSDDQLAQRRARAQHAARVSAQVQRVRRRLTKSIGDERDDAETLTLVRHAAQHVPRRRRRAA